jgi:CheY-like chemotaxis protein
VNYIQSSGESLLNLINDIIDISKIEAKQINIHKVNCAINPILDELFTLFEDMRKNRGCTGYKISIKISDDKNLIIKTDPYRLKQILSNLLHNAMKFTETGTIEFGYEVIGKRIVFFVKDTGIGIPTDKIGFIFERFGKLETSGKNKGGTGLGLAISQNLAKLLGGKLTVESVLGKGSTFYLDIPFIEEDHETVIITTPDYIEKESYNWGSKKVIIAEDEELNFKVLQIALQKTGIEIIRASNGQEAIDAVLMNPDVHIILLDIQMPLIDGYEALTRIKQINFHIPVIAQTAFAMIEEKESCIRIGFNDYISKPIKIPELLRKIDKLIL